MPSTPSHATSRTRRRAALGAVMVLVLFGAGAGRPGAEPQAAPAAPQRIVLDAALPAAQSPPKVTLRLAALPSDAKTPQPSGPSFQRAEFDPDAYRLEDYDLGRFDLDEEAVERFRHAAEHLAAHARKPKPDPIATNGELFVGWTKPEAVLLFTGEQMGYLEPCGCAGLENQKGGLKRRHTLLKSLADAGWPIAAMDAGGQIRRFGHQSQIKFRQSVEALAEIGYGAVGLGTHDLRLGADDLLGVVINLDESKNPLTSANVGLTALGDGFTARLRVLEAGGMKFGVTTVLGAKAVEELAAGSELALMDPSEALAEVVPLLEAEGCDQHVLLVYGDAAEASELARAHDKFDWVVAALGADEPPHRTQAIEGTSHHGRGAHLIETGHKGMYGIVVGLYDGGAEFRYQKTPLDHRFADSEEMQSRFAEYQEELRTMGLEGLGLSPSPHPTGRPVGDKLFAGSAVCGDCHTAAAEAFAATPHAHATETLVALHPARHFDPECLSCHVVGWQPQKYFPYVSGWLSYSETPHLAGQGCENCHGPAARHVAVEYGEIDAEDEEIEELRAALRMEIVPNEGNKEGQVFGAVVKNCVECHDLDNSPDFDFQEYWPAVAHEGKD
ncbi:Cytochrome c-554 precursor [Pseudobythopirellula maris]|uniref:Cytochrome c-554 n=1 Tax=Pseudobythopirellula maris TaxID=2527991 RepID=A0A5C5ZFU8_9BACT|nr:multiheme c-type cytochrome [Pseudobythopirellula maris]TWT86289.1 Cytochrome c-554 precursor [Pseudobythopirellula maris]